jgi:hypothetical protein
LEKRLLDEDEQHLNPKTYEFYTHRRLFLDDLAIFNFSPTFPTDEKALEVRDLETGLTLQCGVLSPKNSEAYQKRYMRMTGKYLVYRDDDDYHITMQTGKMKISSERVCSHTKSTNCYDSCYQYLTVVCVDGTVLHYDFQEKRRVGSTTRNKLLMTFSFSQILDLDSLLLEVGSPFV